TVTPTSLSFSQTLGAAQPAAKTIAVSTNGSDIIFTTTVSTTDGGNWLTVTPPSAIATQATPATLNVTVNAQGLTAKQYKGTITITSASSFTSGSPATVNVTFDVGAGTLSATPATLGFTQLQNGTAPPTQKITVSGTPGA